MPATSRFPNAFFRVGSYLTDSHTSSSLQNQNGNATVIDAAVASGSSADGGSRRVRVASGGAAVGPAAVLLVPGAVRFLQEENRQVQQHGFQDERAAGVPLLRRREPERGGGAGREILRPPVRDGGGGESELARRRFHAQRELHRRVEGLCVS